MILWDIYEISSGKHVLTGVKCRGRLRRRAIDLDMDLLAENATDAEGRVRFALISGRDPTPIVGYVADLFDDAVVERIAQSVPNPVLSKMKVNGTERYD